MQQILILISQIRRLEFKEVKVTCPRFSSLKVTEPGGNPVQPGIKAADVWMCPAIRPQ